MTVEPATLDAEASEGADAEDHETIAMPADEAAHRGVIVPPSNLPAVPEQPRGMIVGSELTIVPLEHELDRMAQLAVTISASDTAPKALQNKPNDVFMVLLTARDLGVGLTTAIREFHVIDGKVTLSPKVRLAMVRSKGLGKVWADPGNNDTTATWYAIRNDLPDVVSSSTYTIEMAGRVKAREGGAQITLAEKSTWKQYPERMLSWRALGYLLDDVFGEVGTGLYSPDELGAVTDEDGVPIIDVVGHADPVRGTRAPRGHNEAPPPLLSDEQRAELQGRIDAISAHHPDARSVLLTLWTARDEKGVPKLGPLERVWASEYKIAEAVVASIEARIKKGEWGAVASASDTEGTGTPDTPPATPDGDSAPVSGDDGPSVEEMATEVVGGMSDEAVVAMLADYKAAVGGSKAQRRARLVGLIVAEETALPESDGADG